MSDEVTKLKEEVFETEAPARQLIVRYFQSIIAVAKRLPVSERDDLAAEMLQPFLELDSPPDGDPELEYIVNQLVGGELDVLSEAGISMSGPDEQSSQRKRKELVWREVIAHVESLRIV